MLEHACKSWQRIYLVKPIQYPNKRMNLVRDLKVTDHLSSTTSWYIHSVYKKNKQTNKQTTKMLQICSENCFSLVIIARCQGSQTLIGI